MAKTHPYFKFYCSEWNDGDITLEDFETQGVFIGLCSLYWSRECNLQEKTVKKRFKKNLKNILTLQEEGIIKILGSGLVKISFLDEQWNGKDRRSSTSKTNGAKGGRPPKPNNLNKPNDNLSNNLNHNLNKPNIEKSIEEKSIEEEKSKPKNKPIDPSETTKPKAGAFEKFFEIFPKKFNPMCNFTRSSFFQAVAIADGEDVILAAASMYADYFRNTNQEIKFASKAQDWLDCQAFKTDWNDETEKFKDKNGKKLSTSRVSKIGKDEKF